MSASNNLQKNKKSKEIWQSVRQNKMADGGPGYTDRLCLNCNLRTNPRAFFQPRSLAAWVTSSGHPAAIIFWEPMIWAGTSWRT